MSVPSMPLVISKIFNLANLYYDLITLVVLVLKFNEYDEYILED